MKIATINPLTLLLAAVVAMLVLSLLLSYMAASFEAAAYERVTGQHVSVWDAMWLDLRVEATPKGKP